MNHNPIEFIKTIHKKGVRYLLIGRQAIIAYGGPVQSMDYDLYVDSAPENIELLIQIAKKIGLSPSIKPDKMATAPLFKLENDYTIDIFKAKYIAIEPGKKLSFAEMYERKTVLKGESGLEINLPSIDDLIQLKRMRNLPKDQLDIKYLKALKNKAHKSIAPLT